MGEEITEEGGEWHVACVRCVFQNWADTTSGQFAEGSFGKDSDAGRDWGQEEKGSTEDEMAGWHHWLDGRESEWTPGVGDGQGGLACCCDSWGCKESDTTEQLNWTELNCTSGKGGPWGAPMSLLDINRQTGSPGVSRSSCDHEGSSEKPSKREKYPVFLRKWSHLHYTTFH